MAEQAVRAGQLRVLAALLVIAAGALLVRSVGEAPRPPDGEVVAFVVDAKDITGVRIHGDRSWRVLRQRGAWWVEPEPGLRLPADPGRAWSLVDAMAEAGAGVLVDLPDDASGLDDPLRVEVEAGGVVRLSVGADAPVGQRTYVDVDGVHLAVGGGIGPAVREGPEAYVRLRLWEGEAPDFVEVRGAEGVITATREETTWRSSPEALPFRVATYSTSTRLPRRRFGVAIEDAGANPIQSPKSVSGMAIAVT